MNEVHSTVVMGKNIKMGHFVVIEAGVVLGDNVVIGDHVVIHEGTKIGDDVIIQANSVLGRWPLPAATSTAKVDPNLPSLQIGNRCRIGAQVVLYRGTVIGEDGMIGDHAFVREACQVAAHVVIGSGVAIEHQVIIGKYTKIQTHAYITAFSTLEEHVFIAPGVITTNDNYMGRTEKRFQAVRGPFIRRGARVGGGAVLLPGVMIAEESMIAAGAVVNRDTEKAKVYAGVPAKMLRPVPQEELREG